MNEMSKLLSGVEKELMSESVPTPPDIEDLSFDPISLLSEKSARLLLKQNTRTQPTTDAIS